MKIPLRLRQFENGVLTLESADSEDEVLQIIKESMSQGEDSYLTAIQLADALSVSVVLAKEYLKIAESTGLACRDESFEGIRFYTNYWASSGP